MLYEVSDGPATITEPPRGDERAEHRDQGRAQGGGALRGGTTPVRAVLLTAAGERAFCVGQDPQGAHRTAGLRPGNGLGPDHEHGQRALQPDRAGARRGQEAGGRRRERRGGRGGLRLLRSRRTTGSSRTRRPSTPPSPGSRSPPTGRLPGRCRVSSAPGAPPTCCSSRAASAPGRRTSWASPTGSYPPPTCAPRPSRRRGRWHRGPTVAYAALKEAVAYGLTHSFSRRWTRRTSCSPGRVPRRTTRSRCGRSSTARSRATWAGDPVLVGSPAPRMIPGGRRPVRMPASARRPSSGRRSAGPASSGPWTAPWTPGVTAGTSARVFGTGRPSGSGACDQISSSSSPGPHSASTRALARVASILARFRMMPASASRRSRSSSVKAATSAISKPAKAARKPGRRRRMVIQDRPGPEGLQAEALVQGVVAVDRAAPFPVVVRHVVRRWTGPRGQRGAPSGPATVSPALTAAPPGPASPWRRAGGRRRPGRRLARTPGRRSRASRSASSAPRRPRASSTSAMR